MSSDDFLREFAACQTSHDYHQCLDWLRLRLDLLRDARETEAVAMLGLWRADLWFFVSVVMVCCLLAAGLLRYRR